MKTLFGDLPDVPVRQMLAEEHPEYKALTKGSGQLTNTELIALLIGGNPDKSINLSRAILTEADGSLLNVTRMSVTDFNSMDGLTVKTAARILAALELGKRRNAEEQPAPDKISSSGDAYRIMSPVIGELGHEEVHIIMMNRANRVIKTIKISQGGISGTVIDIRLILKHAIELLASSMIICHNHPSGNLAPSDADNKITKRIGEACKLVDINLLDHIIVTADSYYSYADEGLI